MKLDCPREQDLLDAVVTRRWPDRADADLRDHVDGCPLCGDLAIFAGAMVDDRECAWAEGTLPAPSAVWWSAQIRAREEAVRLAARPIVIVQAVATICVFSVSVALAPAASGWVRTWIAALGPSGWWSIPGEVSLSWILGTAAYTTLPLLAVGLWIVLAPVVVYLALDD